MGGRDRPPAPLEKQEAIDTAGSPPDAGRVVDGRRPASARSCRDRPRMSSAVGGRQAPRRAGRGTPRSRRGRAGRRRACGARRRARPPSSPGRRRACTLTAPAPPPVPAASARASRSRPRARQRIERRRSVTGAAPSGRPSSRSSVSSSIPPRWSAAGRARNPRQSRQIGRRVAAGGAGPRRAPPRRAPAPRGPRPSARASPARPPAAGHAGQRRAIQSAGAVPLSSGRTEGPGAPVRRQRPRGRPTARPGLSASARAGPAAAGSARRRVEIERHRPQQRQQGADRRGTGARSEKRAACNGGTREARPGPGLDPRRRALEQVEAELDGGHVAGQGGADDARLGPGGHPPPRAWAAAQAGSTWPAANRACRRRTLELRASAAIGHQRQQVQRRRALPHRQQAVDAQQEQSVGRHRRPDRAPRAGPLQPGQRRIGDAGWQAAEQLGQVGRRAIRPKRPASSASAPAGRAGQCRRRRGPRP